ncbi:hypothetical protein [Pseudolysobacter antarcticus]|nr:hypothetical protein [Pseudolysobacter antarcticus]
MPSPSDPRFDPAARRAAARRTALILGAVALTIFCLFLYKGMGG